MSISVKDLSVSIGGARSNKFNIEISGCKFTLSGFSLSQRLLDHSYLSFSLIKNPLEDISDTQFQACADMIGMPVELTLQTDSMEVEMEGFSGGDKAADIEFKGFVNNISASRDNSNYTILVSAVSYDAQLDDSPDCRSWLDKSLKDIIEDTLKNAKDLESEVDPVFTDENYTYCVKWNESSYNFIQRMAIRHGEWLFNNGKKLFFGKMPEGESVQLSYPSKDMTSYHISIRTQHLNFRHIAANEVIDDTTTHNNLDEMEGSINKLNDAAFDASQSNYPQATMENIIAAGFNWEHNGEQGFVKSLDTPQAKGTRASLLTYQGSTSCPKLNVGVKLTVIDNYINDEQSNGKSDVQQDEILITSVSHTFDNDEFYSNSFTGISAKAEFPPYANAAAIPRALSCRAWVKDNNDPEEMGRVRVYFPWGQQGPNNDSEEMLTPWIRVEQAYAGSNRGAYIIPEKNDEVMIDFEGGNAEMPYVRSSVFNCQSHMDFDWACDKTVPANQIKAIRTRNGHTIEVHDEGSDGYIRIYDYEKENYILTFSTDEKLIKLRSSGNIEMYADHDIIMKAGNDIKVTAGHDKNLKVGHDYSISVKNDETEKVDHDHTEMVSNNYTLAVTNNISETANNEFTAHSDKDMTLTTSANYTLQSEGEMYVEAEKDYMLNLGGNSETVVKKDQSNKVQGNADFSITQALQLSGKDITIQAQNELNEYSVSQNLKASNAIGINATATIDIKAMMIKEN